MSYKFGATQWGLPGNGLYAVRIAHEAGLDGLQIELGGYEHGYYMADKRIQSYYLEDGARYGVEFPSIVLNDLGVNDFVHGRNTEKGRIAYEQLRLGVEVAAAMEVGMVMVPNFFENFITEESHYRHAAEALKYVCDLAGQKGLQVASETVLRWSDHKKILDMVKMPNIGVFFDSMNYKFFSGYDQLEMLEELYPHMVPQLHVKDGTDSLSGALLGKGNMDFHKQIELLLKKGYSGWIIMENYYDQLPNRALNEFDGTELLKEDLRTLKTALGV